MVALLDILLGPTASTCCAPCVHEKQFFVFYDGQWVGFIAVMVQLHRPYGYAWIDSCIWLLLCVCMLVCLYSQ